MQLNEWYKLIAVEQVPVTYYSEYGSVRTAYAH